AWLEEAGALHEAGRLVAAESRARRALRLVERGAGPKGINAAPVLVTLGRIRADLRPPREAIALLERALALRGRARDDAEARALALDTQQGLAQCLIDAGEYAQAARVVRKALAAAETTHGRAHAEVAVLLNSLGVTCKYRARFAEGARVYRRAL